jgi:ornithine carbamoyltransferase
MNPLLHHRTLWSLNDLSRRDVLALLETAHALKRACRAGASHRLLRGKNVALLSESEGGVDACAFDRAATELGAHVAHIRPSDSRLTGDADVSATARLLGRLYDAIECEGITSQVVGELDRHAGVPVFNGLGRPEHPTHVLADLMTMAELSGKPLPELRVCVFGQAASDHGSALLRAAALAGVGVHEAERCNPSRCSADFVYDETAGTPTLKATRPCMNADNAFEAERDVNQRFALQAMLVSTIT